MTDTTILPNVPAYVQLDNNRGYHYNQGITDKDRMHLDSDSLNDAMRDLVKDVAAVGIAVEKTGAAGELATEKTAAAIQLANSLAFANTQNLLVSGFKDGRYDAAVNAAAAALAAATNTAAINAHIAECCCEIKELVREDGGKTRELMQSIDAARLAGQLSDAKDEINFLRFAAANKGNGNGNGNND